MHLRHNHSKLLLFCLASLGALGTLAASVSMAMPRLRTRLPVRTVIDGVVQVHRSPRELSVQATVESLISNYHLEDGGDQSTQVISLKLSPSLWPIYAQLQTRIAQLIPTEEKRPTIDLALTDTPTAEPEQGIGILGGMGPLADSQLIKLVMNQLEKSEQSIDWNRLGIHLYSAPPPRSEGITSTKSIRYAERLLEFATRGFSKYYLASNTAHIHYGAFRAFVQATFLRRMWPQNSLPLVDLVDEVAHQMSPPNRPPAPTLFLTSLATYENRLFSPHLTSLGWEEGGTDVMNPGDPSHDAQFYWVSSRETAETLQEAIDLAKSGNLSLARRKMKPLILEEARRLPRTQGKIQLVFGCTEISLSYAGAAAQHLKNALSLELGVPVEIIDSQAFFATRITQDLLALSRGDD